MALSTIDHLVAATEVAVLVSYLAGQEAGIVPGAVYATDGDFSA